MSKHTKILIFHLKPILITILFVLIAIIIFFIAFSQKKQKKEDVNHTQTAKYIAGIYTSSIYLQNEPVQIQLTIDTDQIKAASISSQSDSIAAMYPLLDSSMEALSQQLKTGLSLAELNISQTSPYTSQMLIQAIEQTAKRAIPES